MKPGAREIKNTILDYFKNAYGFAPLKSQLKVENIEDDKIVFSCNGRMFNMPYRVIIEWGHITEHCECGENHIEVD